MDSIVVKSVLDWLHILATIVWFGGMFVNLFILRPLAFKFLSPAEAGRLMGALMKRFRVVVYLSIVILGVTGIPLKIVNENYISIINFENHWEIISFIKHLCYGLMVVLAVYSFEILNPAVGRVASKGPSLKLQKLQRQQKALGGMAILLALVILVLSSTMRYS